MESKWLNKKYFMDKFWEELNKQVKIRNQKVVEYQALNDGLEYSIKTGDKESEQFLKKEIKNFKW